MATMPRSTWIVPLWSAFAISCGVTLVAFGAGQGCQTRCFNAFDCGDGAFCFQGRCETECFTDQDCTNPPECEGNPAACQCKGLRCNPVGRCVGRCSGASTGGSVRGPGTGDEDVDIEGWERQPGDGQGFIVDSLAIADEGRGFDIDGRCRGTGDMRRGKR